MVDRYPLDTPYDALFREGRGATPGQNSASEGQIQGDNNLRVGIAPKRLPYHTMRPPTYFWEFANGGSTTHGARLMAKPTAERNPFEMMGGRLLERAGRKQHSPALDLSAVAKRPSPPSPIPSNRSMGMSMVGTVAAPGLDSSRSLGGFSEVEA